MMQIKTDFKNWHAVKGRIGYLNLTKTILPSCVTKLI